MNDAVGRGGGGESFGIEICVTLKYIDQIYECISVSSGLWELPDCLP